VIKSKRTRWAGHATGTEERKAAYSILVGKPEGMKLLGRLRRKWTDNIKIDFQEV
jgi:hypothetical protein